MEKNFLTPGEIIKVTIDTGIKKSNLPFKNCMLLGILAGLFIGLGGLGNILISQTLTDPGISKFAGACIFPIGLMLVVVCGAELFTGNNLMTLSILEKKITYKSLFKNWSVVYIGNFIGSILLVLAIFFSNTLSQSAIEKVVNIAQSKVELTFIEALIKGILCNIMVVLAVLFATAGKDIVSKVFACWFPIMLFVLCGFEHSIANMFFIPMGMILGAKITIVQLLFNLIVVTFGNIIGGAIIIPYIYHSCYVNK
ncbi:formate/nitrite transporter family protein [Paraclostridium sordellii]|uniref:formate/nitrite transporter family protein n=1 Tax=Paraclostridium sordellii TaxID=1505 RepID=UPI0005E2A9F7|nr:formate/nitrite transporter family protein [Paeniclostridium sordellii]CEN76943.1 formate/nitrite transporter [[Clostridium] sordellii] [Paeniclostridium sordellii]CEO29595.1 formate/nitrite transporter [[Clostridium] sordellii] [Paeniclostridium sordellii]